MVCQLLCKRISQTGCAAVVLLRRFYRRHIIINIIQKSEAIKAGPRKGFQDGSSKMAHRKCYEYEIGADGELMVNPDEAQGDMLDI